MITKINSTYKQYYWLFINPEDKFYTGTWIHYWEDGIFYAVNLEDIEGSFNSHINKNVPKELSDNAFIYGFNKGTVVPLCKISDMDIIHHNKKQYETLGEMIKALQDIYNDFGDMPVTANVLSDSYDNYCYSSEVEFVVPKLHRRLDGSLKLNFDLKD